MTPMTDRELRELVVAEGPTAAELRAEADRVHVGEWPASDNPLVNAPHTAETVVASEWSHPYSRETAVYPVHSLVRTKYWPPVRRIDNAYGDRNLVCACPPVEAFA